MSVPANVHVCRYMSVRYDTHSKRVSLSCGVRENTTELGSAISLPTHSRLYTNFASAKRRPQSNVRILIYLRRYNRTLTGQSYLI